MEFLDRQAELARLHRLSDCGEGGFVAIWGRRRIGKSELLKQWCRRSEGLYAVADRSVAPVQRRDFATVVAGRFPGFDEVVYPSWKALFAALSLRARAAEWHGPLVLDEFPYLVESDDTLPSVLQNWIDGERAAHGLLVAIAGSSQHMMQGLVLDANSPIYGRADERFCLSPLAIPFIRRGLHLRNPLDAVRSYAVWGGVPRYWVAAERYGADLETALDEQVLDPLGPFHEEPATLLQSEVPSVLSLKPYLDIIGLGVNRVSEIAARMALPATTISKPLARLVDLGLVRREVPYGENEKNSKKSLYRIADPFCRLWFHVVASRRSVFDSAPPDVRRALWKSLCMRLYAAQWEDLAREHVVLSVHLRTLAGEGDYWSPAGRWWRGTEPELDVVSFNGLKTRTLLGEAKWSETPFGLKETKRLASELNGRAVPNGFPAEVVRVLFLASVARDVPKTVLGVHIVDARSVVRGAEGD